MAAVGGRKGGADVFGLPLAMFSANDITDLRFSRSPDVDSKPAPG
jgi:hypothetical protein